MIRPNGLDLHTKRISKGLQLPCPLGVGRTNAVAHAARRGVLNF